MRSSEYPAVVILISSRRRLSRPDNDSDENDDSARACSCDHKPPSTTTGLDRFATAKIYLDQLFAQRNARDDLLYRRVNHRRAVRVGVTAIEAERNPAGVRLLLRFFIERDARNLFRRHRLDVVRVNVAVYAIHDPYFFLIRGDAD